MAEMKGGELIVEFLIKEKVPYVFGICGHGTVGILDALHAAQGDIKLVSPRHEQTAGHMAAKAAERALDMSGVKAQELDLIIHASFTPSACVPGDHVIVAESGYCSLRELGAFEDTEVESPGGGLWGATVRKSRP